MELYLIRHTTPEVPAGICYGRTEIGLPAGFEAEAGAVRGKLAHLEHAACYSSPLSRCVRLASLLGWGEPQLDPRLQELDFGAWEMQPWDAIPRSDLDRWGQHYVDVAPPGGESFRDLQRRASEFLGELAADRQTSTVVAVTHAGIIRGLLAEALDLPLREAFHFHLDYGGVTLLRLDGAIPAVGYVNR